MIMRQLQGADIESSHCSKRPEKQLWYISKLNLWRRTIINKSNYDARKMIYK